MVNQVIMGDPATGSLPAPVLASLSDTFVAQRASVSTLVEPILISHRGGAGTHPEHSMEGYRASFRNGYMPEQDVQVLSDGTLVCIHDSTVDRTMTGTGAVNSLTRAQWRALRIKSPTFGGREALPVEWAQVLDELGGRAVLCPEVKAAAALYPLLDSIEARSLTGTVLVQSFTYSHCVAAAERGHPTLFLSNTVGTAPAPTAAEMIAAGVEWTSCSTAASGGYISGLISAGLKVIVYTVNDKSTYATAISDGASGVFSDDCAWLEGFYTKHDADPFAEKNPWPGFRAIRAGNPAVTWVFSRANEVGVGTEYAAGVVDGIAHRWAGKRGPYVRIRWTLRYLPTSSPDISRWGGSMYVGTPPPGADENAFGDDIAAGANGYQVFVRRNGEMHIYRYSNGVPASLAAVATTTVAWAGSGGSTDLELIIRSDLITFTRLDTGHTLTAVPPVVLATDGCDIVSRFNNTVARISKMTVEDMPA